MHSPNNQAAQLEAAIQALEGLRGTLGDREVDAAVAPLRQQLEALRGSASSMHIRLPDELVAKARAAGWKEGERKQVTVLFADLAGFTSVSERADPELIRAFQTELFAELTRTINQYDGFVEKFAGDAVLAVFGAPVTHEDDAERALRVALAMRARVAELDHRWSDKLGSRVTLHIGINTGTVVAGTFGPDVNGGSASYAVTGDTVNTAARLQEAAKPGEVLASHATYRLAQEAFTFQELDAIRVKGRTQPVAVYKLLRARPLPGKLRGLHQLGESFVGRDAELQSLLQWTEGLNETGGMVVISGEAGIGKSRLIAEWRKQSRAQIRWLEGRCFAHTWNLSYGPFLDMLRRFTGIVDDDTDRRARQRLDLVVGQLFPDDGKAEAQAILAHVLGMRLSREEANDLAKLPARALRERIFRIAQQMVGRLAQQSPLVILLEDMQWADASSLELLESLLPLIASVPLLVVIARRPETDVGADGDGDAQDELSRPLHTTSLASLEGALTEYADRTQRITLDSLPEASQLDMLRGLLSVDEPPPELVEIISSKTEGNPFFVEEIIRALIELGGLERGDHGWDTTPQIKAIHVPDTVQALIAARIDRLPDETKDVVQHAAVIGRTFLYRVLLAVAHASPSLDADLSHLQRSELIRERTREPEVEFTFKHALTQEVAYNSLLQSRRRDFHRRVGEAFERIFAGRLGEIYPVIAEHFAKGEVWDKAATYYIRAGEHASDLFATEATAHFDQALRALGHLRATNDVRRRRVDVSIAVAREVLYGPGTAHAQLDVARRYLTEAEPLAEVLAPGDRPATRDDQRRRVRLYAWLMNCYSALGESRQATTYLEKTRSLADHVDDPEVAARIGQVLLHRGRFSDAERYLAFAAGELELSGRWLDWVHANGSLAISHAAMGNLRVAQDLARRGVDRAKNLQLQGQYLILAAEQYRAFVHCLIGKPDLSGHLFDPLRGTQDDVPNPVLRQVHGFLGGLYARRVPNAGLQRGNLLQEHLDGRAANASQRQEGEQDNAQAGPARDAVLPYVARRAAALAGVALRENHSEAEQLAREALDLALQREDMFAEGLARRYLAGALARGDPQAAQAELQKSVQVFRNGGCHVEEARTLVRLGKTARELKDETAAEYHISLAQEIFERAGMTWELDWMKDELSRPWP